MSPKTMNRREFLKTIGRSAVSLTLGANLIEWLSGCAPHLSPTVNSQDKSASTAVPDVEFSIKAVITERSIFPGKATTVWQYQGEVIRGDPGVLTTIPNSYLGPIIRLKTGQTVRVHFTNELKEESIIHWHGLHINEEADGHPRYVIDSGETFIYDFTVMNRAGTYWYHPHPHGRTGPQVYNGLSGLLLVSDEEEQALELPSGEYDLPLVIQDRTFDRKNQLVYNRDMMAQMAGFFGNQILVNGIPDYHGTVETRSYRMRILNGSNARIYKLAWQDGTPLTVIGADGGLLEKPIEQAAVTLCPAQRIELWLDFSERPIGEELKLISLPFTGYGGEASFPILTFTVEKQSQSSSPLPDQLTEINWHQVSQAVNQTNPRLFELAMGRGMSWNINGEQFDMLKAAENETVKLGDLEVWEFYNNPAGGMMHDYLPHPMHVHGLQFQVLERTLETGSTAAYQTLSNGFVDQGWQDTVLVMPGERVKILLKFEDFTGLYMYHCHNLEHEDMGMMRNYLIEA